MVASNSRIDQNCNLDRKSRPQLLFVCLEGTISLSKRRRICCSRSKRVPSAARRLMELAREILGVMVMCVFRFHLSPISQIIGEFQISFPDWTGGEIHCGGQVLRNMIDCAGSARLNSHCHYSTKSKTRVCTDDAASLVIHVQLLSMVWLSMWKTAVAALASKHCTPMWRVFWCHEESSFATLTRLGRSRRRNLSKRHAQFRSKSKTNNAPNILKNCCINCFA